MLEYPDREADDAAAGEGRDIQMLCCSARCDEPGESLKVSLQRQCNVVQFACKPLCRIGIPYPFAPPLD
jgi:hypothetical protein